MSTPVAVPKKSSLNKLESIFKTLVESDKKSVPEIREIVEQILNKPPSIIALETAIEEIVKEEQVDNRSIKQAVDKILRKPKREGGFRDEQAMNEIIQWANAFREELKEYFDDEEEYDKRSSSDIWNDFSMMLERLNDGYEQLNVIQVDPKKHKAMKVFYARMREYWDDLSSGDGYLAFQHRDEFEEFLKFGDL
jgi:uncharacterized Zn finger protein